MWPTFAEGRRILFLIGWPPHIVYNLTRVLEPQSSGCRELLPLSRRNKRILSVTATAGRENTTFFAVVRKAAVSALEVKHSAVQPMCLACDEKCLPVRRHKFTLLQKPIFTIRCVLSHIFPLISPFSHLVPIVMESLRGEEFQLNYFSPAREVQGTERHAVAFSSSHFGAIIPPILCEQVITTLSTLWKIGSGWIASYKVCIKQIHHAARW